MESLSAGWESYLLAHRQSEIEAVSAEFPARRSVTVDLVDLYRADEALAQAVFATPARALLEGRAVVRDLTDASGPVQIQLENNPQQYQIPRITTHHLYELVTVRGVVKSVGSRQASVVTARHTCPACESSIGTTVAEIEHTDPARCADCGWDGPFDFHPQQSEFVDTQRLTLGPLPDHRDNREAGDPLRAYLSSDLVGAVAVDDHVGITGILRPRRGGDSPLFDLYLDAVHIRDERDLTPPEEITAVLDSQWDTSAR